jgi:hypothetical protein
MKIKLLIIVAILTLLVLIGPRLLSITIATWNYFHTDLVCFGRDPTPPYELGDQLPFPLYEIKPYKVIIDRGIMYPGDEYVVQGEGWGGSITLLWAGRDRAIFSVNFLSHTYSDLVCRWFTPIGTYR